MKTVVMVASHKPYWIPTDPMYLPVQVGSAGKPSLDWQRDDDGENISSKNATFCELTGLFWMWKHLDADAYGLAHYRRYFSFGLAPKKKDRILTNKHAQHLLAKHSLVLPRKRHYYIETNYSQYVHAHHETDLLETAAILTERYPEYIPAWEREMARRSGHRFNMFLMRAPLFHAYCEWLFDILFALENKLDISAYSASDQRVFGYVAERLLDVWVETNRISYAELPVVNLENQHWGKKIFSFLRRKITGGKKTSPAAR